MEELEQQLARYRPRRSLLRVMARRSAVALILQQRGEQTYLLMIQRAERVGDPWSGHMAFPGGHMERSDRHGRAAAARETAEEIGLDLSDVPCIGRLSDVMARPKMPRPMIVSPYVFRLDEEVDFVLNYEVADTVWIPVSYFLDSTNREQMKWMYRGVSIDLPCYFYQGKRVWGLSLSMLDELLKIIG